MNKKIQLIGEPDHPSTIALVEKGKEMGFDIEVVRREDIPEDERPSLIEFPNDQYEYVPENINYPQPKHFEALKLPLTRAERRALERRKK